MKIIKSINKLGKSKIQLTGYGLICYVVVILAIYDLFGFIGSL